MKIILASAHPYIPQIAGGAQSSTHELAKELLARGHSVAVLAGLTGDGWTGLRARALLKLGRGMTVADDDLGYRTYRAWFPQECVAEVVARESPDVALLQSGLPVPLALAFQSQGVTPVLYLRNVEFEDLGGDPRAVAPVAAIANSRFTATRFEEAFDQPSRVVHPLMQAENYITQPERRNVTFINPHPLKGVRIALDVAAACPEIPFVFVEAWTLDADERRALSHEVDALPNVTLRPRMRDMRDVYRDARMVLVPSQWEEAFGRIVAEAQVSGIPAVASDCGGLPEAVGPGGILLPPQAPVADWAEAVRSLWHDADRYAALSAAAREHSLRPDMQIDVQMANIEAVLQAAVQQRHAA